MTHALGVSRTFFYHLWLRAIFIRTPRFKPLLRAEFARECFYDQAGFLLKAGYYNAAVCIVRLAVEKALQRLMLIHPDWADHRSVPLSSMILLLAQKDVFSKGTKNRMNRWTQRANKCVHKTAIGKAAAISIVHDAEALRPIIDRAMRELLQR